MIMKRFILMASAGGLMAVAAASFAAPQQASHTVTIPHDDSWIPPPSTTAAQAADASDDDASAATRFHFQPVGPHAADRPPPVDPATVGRMPEDSGSDARVPQACWSNPHQPKCH